MEDGSVVILIIFVIIVIAFVFYVSNQNEENSNNSADDYLGGYDGGHNNYDMTNIAQPNEYEAESNEQTLQIKTEYMHDIRNLTISVSPRASTYFIS